jgi:UDP-N-acetylmuramoylalanine--D-glutamate ligase
MPVSVVGLARSGVAAARFLLKLGCQVRATEKSEAPLLKEETARLEKEGVRVELGEHTREFIRGSQLVVVSPGVPLDSPPVRWAKEEGIPVVSELELGAWYAQGSLVAVTGSNGKSTVVTLLGEILKAAGKEVVVCGNIGTPLTSVLDSIGPSTTVLLEVSSFQLESSLSFHAQIACLLNVTDNHLDRHGSFQEYAKAKARIFSYQRASSFAVLNADDPVSWSMRPHVRGRWVAFSRKRKVPGAFLEGDGLTLALEGESRRICRRGELARAGLHHEENALAVSCMAGLLGVAPEISGGILKSFRGLPHRQEVVATVDGVTFVNDSKSTTLASGIRAIEAAPGPVVLIAGGRDKGSDFRKLASLKKKLKVAILIGEDGPKIAGALQGLVATLRAANLREAVRVASSMAQPGEWILLSPMCTSFDMFRDFEERGEKFVEAVHALSSSNGRNS